LKASDFEFKFRFWIFGAIFFVAFYLYAVDHVNSAVALLQALAPSINPQSNLGENWLRLIYACGALLVFIAAALRTWGTAYLQAAVVHDMNLHSHRVVADGPFRYTRNPLYFGNLFLAIGIGVMASRAGFVFLVIAMLLYSYRLIWREEDALKTQQGEAYLAYLAAVPRYWPSLTPRVPSGDATPHWGQAFLGECAFWLFGIGVLAFAVTLNPKLSDSIFIAAYVAYFVSLTILKSKARSQQST
jgi:protein-S-isoprenylcysteine O-methyltransferase Ste14